MVTSTTFGTGEFGRGKTLLALTVVIGCFAILWPKIFYPMLTSSLFPGYSGGDGGDLCCDVIFEKDTNAYKLMNEICANIIKKEGLKPSSKGSQGSGQAPVAPTLINHPPKNKWYKNYTSSTPSDEGAVLSTTDLCRNEILKTCKVDVVVLLNENPTMSKDYMESLTQLRSFNVSQCLKDNYGVHLEGIGLPKRFKVPESSPRHMRPERPIHMPQTVHPALREKGNAIPHPPRRTMEIETRQPGPQPGIRPPMGGGLNTPAPPRGGGGTMGVIMPLYTIGIVCFFLYTIFKILFRKSEENTVKDSRVRDFGMDPEHRKYILSDEYEAGNNRSIRDPYYREPDHGVRRRSSAGIAPIPTIPVIQDIKVPKQIAPIAMATGPEKEKKANGSGPKEHDARDTEIDILRKRLEETEAAMERIVKQMGSVSEHLSPALLAQVLQKQAILQSEDAAPAVEASNDVAEAPAIPLVPKATLELTEPDHMRRRAGQPKRPPTPINLVASESEESEEEVEEEQRKIITDREKQIFESCEIVKFAQELSSLILKQGLASAAVTLAFANRNETSSPGGRGHRGRNTAESVSVVGMDESVGLENGEKWTDRSPTPTFPRLSSPLPPQRPSTPPAEVRNIYLEGPIPSPANQILISNSECEEVDMDEDYDYDDDEDYDSENDKPVVLSGKVTLSVLSGIGEDRTEAPSFSVDEDIEVDQAFSVAGQLENAIKDSAEATAEVPNGSVPNVAQQQSKGSSPDMDEYEVVGKEGLNGAQVPTEELDATHYTTADAELEPFKGTGEETSADISVMEGLNEDEEEYDEEEDEEEEDEDDEEEEDADEEEEEESEEEEPAKVPSKGSASTTPSPRLSSPPSPSPYGTYFTEP